MTIKRYDIIFDINKLQRYLHHSFYFSINMHKALMFWKKDHNTLGFWSWSTRNKQLWLKVQSIFILSVFRHWFNSKLAQIEGRSGDFKYSGTWVQKPVSVAVVEVSKSSECSALNTDNFIQKQIWLLVLSALIQGGSLNPIRVFLNPGSVPLCFLVLYEALRFHADYVQKASFRHNSKVSTFQVVWQLVIISQ